jgi:hypothetical protein
MLLLAHPKDHSEFVEAMVTFSNALAQHRESASCSVSDKPRTYDLWHASEGQLSEKQRKRFVAPTDFGRYAQLQVCASSIALFY